MIIGNVRNTKLKAAIESANTLLTIDQFYDDIRGKTFDKATCSGDRIAVRLKEFHKSNTFKIVEYRSFFPSAVNAYVNNNDPKTIHINTRNLGRSLASIIATVIHELVHAVDIFDLIHSYGHGDNSSAGKNNCAPNWIGNRSKSYVNGSEDYNEAPKIKYKKSFWYYIKPWNWF